MRRTTNGINLSNVIHQHLQHSAIVLYGSDTSLDPARLNWTANGLQPQADYNQTFQRQRLSRDRPLSECQGGLQVGRVYINTNGVFRIGDSQMQLTSAGKTTISPVITDATTGNQSTETDYATLQSSS